METKEKAQELFNKMCIGKAKECALIAVDMILSLFITECEDTRYWQEVKQDIEKL